MTPTTPLLPTTLLAAAATLALAGCPLVDVEVQAEQVCVAVNGVEFDGVVALPASAGPVSVERTVDLDDEVARLRDSFDGLGLDATHTLTSVSVSLASPEPTRFDFVQALDIVASSPSLETFALVQCDDCGLATRSIAVDIDRANLTPHVEAGALRLDLAVMGDVPEQPWSVDVELCFDTAGRYRREW